MKPDRIHRFSWGERIFHWANGILYLGLFLTGTLLLVSRIFTLESLPSSLLSRIHRTSGLILVGLLLVILILSVCVPTFRELWKTLRQCLTWKRSDVLWLLKVPINMVFPRCVLPPADRFNPGQKMHLLVVFSALLGFSISGLTMIWVPGALGAWVIHLVCFVPAFVFLSLHLFLSLINPETRKALSAMFTGHIHVDYARAHHALWEAVSKGTSMHGSYVSWKYVCVVGTLLAVGLGLGIRGHGVHAFARDLDTLVTTGGASAMLPGPLCAGHGSEETLKTCRACHSLFRTVQDQPCLACHLIIAGRLEEASGFHGTLRLACRECHAEHQGLGASLIDLEALDFTHDKALFPLEGQHQDVNCVDCHEKGQDRFHYLGIDHVSCVSCHHDPHQDEQAASCRDCHTPETWSFKDKVFDHAAETSFALNGKHEALVCQACHKQDEHIQLHDLGEQCSDCHEDPHAGQFIETCDQCHIEEGFKEVRQAQFHGDPNTFLLKGKHAPLPCQACHSILEGQTELARAKFVGLGQGCADCHQDPHQARMDDTCESCHQETGFKGGSLLFVHDQHTRFKLDGQHKPLKCGACHVPRDLRFEAAGLECKDCHTPQALALAGQASTVQLKPDPHFNRLACMDCHDLSAANQSSESYATRCEACHTPHYQVLFRNWQDSLSNQQQTLEKRLSQSALTSVQKAPLKQRLSEARHIGSHHMPLAQELLKQIRQETTSGQEID